MGSILVIYLSIHGLENSPINMLLIPVTFTYLCSVTGCLMVLYGVFRGLFACLGLPERIVPSSSGGPGRRPGWCRVWRTGSVLSARLRRR